MGVSYIAQWDPRVKAVVAWDNLGPADTRKGPKCQAAPGARATIGEKSCPADPADRTVVPITKPGLGMSADYGLPPTPNTSLPEPLGKSKQSLAYSAAGVDSGEIIIRGGSHLDFSFIPNQAFGASLRGPDMIDWYTTAWFDKYLKHERSADKRLLTNRWRDEPLVAEVDPNKDANAFSFYYLSRLDIHLFKGNSSGIARTSAKAAQGWCRTTATQGRTHTPASTRRPKNDRLGEPAGPPRITSPRLRPDKPAAMPPGRQVPGDGHALRSGASALCLTPFGRTSPGRDGVVLNGRG